MTLDDLKAQWKGCDKCNLCLSRKNTVFGSGKCNSIMVINEAPMFKEDDLDAVLVGPSGDLFNKFLQSVELPREELYLTNVVMCRTPGDRPPDNVELSTCRVRLLQEIYLVDPVVILALGAIAAKALLSTKTVVITKEAGKLHDISIPGVLTTVSYPMLITYHPQTLLRRRDMAEGGLWYQAFLHLNMVKDILLETQKLLPEEHNE